VRRVGRRAPAAGGVVTLAVQLAKTWGAGRVIGVASSEEKRRLAEELGADVAVEAGATDLKKALEEAHDGRKVDVVLEMVGGATFDASPAALAPFGRLAIFGMASRTAAKPVQSGELVARHEHGTGLSGFLPPSWDHRGCQSWDHRRVVRRGSGCQPLAITSRRSWRDRVAFREVRVIEVREVLRAWLSGEGLRVAAERAGVDRKTARRYVVAGQEAGLVRDGGEEQLSDELIGAVVAAVGRPGPRGTAARGRT
jgi:hypothetical protein